MTSSNEWQKMVNGELYWAWDEDLQANRERCKAACERYNNAGQVSRRRRVGYGENEWSPEASR